MRLFEPKDIPDGPWEVWYAWHPVWRGKVLVWLEHLERQLCYYNDIGYQWHYRDIPKQD